MGERNRFCDISGWRMHESVEDTKLSTNKQHSLSRYHIKKGLVLGKGLKIVRYQTFISKRNQTPKRKEKKRNEGRVNKKRRVEDVEKVEKFVNQFAKRLRIDDE